MIFFFHTKNSCNLISPHECTRLVLIPNRFQVYSYLLWFLIFNHELVLIWWCTSCTTILHFVIERFSSIRYFMYSAWTQAPYLVFMHMYTKCISFDNYFKNRFIQRKLWLFEWVISIICKYYLLIVMCVFHIYCFWGLIVSTIQQIYTWYVILMNYRFQSRFQMKFNLLYYTSSKRILFLFKYHTVLTVIQIGFHF